MLIFLNELSDPLISEKNNIGSRPFMSIGFDELLVTIVLLYFHYFKIRKTKMKEENSLFLPLCSKSRSEHRNPKLFFH